MANSRVCNRISGYLIRNGCGLLKHGESALLEGRYNNVPLFQSEDLDAQFQYLYCTYGARHRSSIYTKGARWALVSKIFFCMGQEKTHHQFLFCITFWRSNLALRLLGGRDISYTGEPPLGYIHVLTENL